MARPTQDSDSLYHRIFSHPQMVVDLLLAFMDPELLALINLAGLRRYNTKFTGRSGQRRRSDVVWEIPTHQGGSLFIVLILEFQSRVEEWMILRYGGYAFLLYEQLVDERKLKAVDGLPPVIPLLIYNGEPRWNAAVSLRGLIRLPEETSLWKIQPEMHYHVIDEGAYSKEVLEASPYLSAILFRMEHPASPEDMMQAAQDAAEWFEKHPEGPPVKHLFRELLLAGLNRMKVDIPSVIPDQFQEVVIMLTARVEKWAMEYEQKGVQIGEQKGMMALLIEQISERFGSVPDWARSKLSQADMDTLKKWGKGIFRAEKLDDIFQ